MKEDIPINNRSKHTLIFMLVVLIFAGCSGSGERSESADENKVNIEDLEPGNIDVEAPRPPKKEEVKVKPSTPNKSKSGNTTSSVTSTTSKISNEDLVKMFPPLVAPEKDPEQLEKKENLLKGQMSHYIPDSIVVGIPFAVSLTISDTMVSKVELRAATADRASIFGNRVKKEKVKVREIKIAEKMRARLYEPPGLNNFDFDPKEPVERVMLKEEGENLMEWQWSVVAKEPGEHPLLMEIEAVFYNDAGEVVKNIPVFSENVLVQSVRDNSWIPYVVGGVLAALFTVLFMKFRPGAAPSTVESIIEKIGQGETAEAIRMLKSKKLSQTNENLLVNHLAEFNDIRRQFNGGMIERSEMQMVVNRIHNSLLEICDEITNA